MRSHGLSWILWSGLAMSGGPAWLLLLAAVMSLIDTCQKGKESLELMLKVPVVFSNAIELRFLVHVKVLKLNRGNASPTRSAFLELQVRCDRTGGCKNCCKIICETVLLFVEGDTKLFISTEASHRWYSTSSITLLVKCSITYSTAQNHITAYSKAATHYAVVCKPSKRLICFILCANCKNITTCGTCQLVTG